VIKNIVLITVDALRADHLSCFGYTRNTTPNIDFLANNDVLFLQAISNAPYTKASFVAMLTSTYPLMYGGYTYISEQRVTIAEILKEKGYSTAAFQSNPWLSTHYGFDKGFDTFEDAFESSKDKLSKKSIAADKIKKKIKNILNEKSRMYDLLKRFYHFSKRIDPLPMPYASADVINQKAISWLNDNLDDNFFLWMHYMDVHGPYNPPQKCMRQISPIHITKKEIARLHAKMFPKETTKNELEMLIDLYDGGIMYTDYSIGLFLDKLKEMGVLDTTLVIITADHGDEFGDHGGFGHGGGNRAVKTYDELLHVPLIIKCPGIGENVKIKDQVSLLSLAPTIVDILNIPEVENFQGKSLLPLIKGRGSGEDCIISEALQAEYINKPQNTDKKIISYRTENWKYIYTDQCELYDLRNDPKEKENIVDKEVEKAEEFKSKIVQHIAMEEDSTRQLVKREKEKVKGKIKELKSIGKI
jgi:arylsulfatase A-like enzyme